jgi:hypothetical protein
MNGNVSATAAGFVGPFIDLAIYDPVELAAGRPVLRDSVGHRNASPQA